MYEFNAVINPTCVGFWWTVLPGSGLPFRIDRISELDLQTMRLNYPEGNGHLWWGPIPQPSTKDASPDWHEVGRDSGEAFLA